MQDPRTAQIKIKSHRYMVSGLYGLGPHWVTPERARVLVEQGVAEIVGAQPTVRPGVGPVETPAAGPLEKKSSAAVPDGRSIASASSSVPGPAALSSSSAADPVSPLTNAQPLAKPVRRGKSPASSR
jgi:hypothetical protein